jgi:hydroxymethylpyrimidine pyrophosphatase-like HAD family hydrolase
LDKTLLNTDKNIPPENVLAIKELKSNHILPVISTGKNLYELKEIVNSSGINTIIGANGSDLVFRGQHVYQLPIGQAQINRLCNQANIDNIAIGFHNDKGIAITKRNKYTESLFDEMRRPQPPVDPDFYKNNVVTMLLVFIPTTLEGTILEKKYKLKFPELHFMRNSDITIDTVNTGV